MPACFLGGWFRVGRAIFSRELKSLPAVGLRPRCPGGDLCRPLSFTRGKPPPARQPWSRTPRLNGVIAFDAAWRLRPRRPDPDGFSEEDRRGSRSAFTLFFG